jgi:NAD(P)-dependent dehydrogenase (short-subunit alcohol dehydrogenase family)
MEKLNGKVAVVTGGSSGIGEAIATRFVDEGAYVFIVGRRQAELDRAKVEIGRNVTAAKADVTSQPDLDKLFSTVKSEKGGLDIIVTSAGMFEQHMLDGASYEHFDEQFNLNVRGTFFTVKNRSSTSP